MTVQELIKILKTHDPNMTVITPRYSDFVELNNDPEVMQVLKDNDEWFTHYYPHQHKTEPRNLVTVLYIGE